MVKEDGGEGWLAASYSNSMIMMNHIELHVPGHVPAEPSTISILKPDNIGQIVSFSNIPDFLNLLFVDHYFRDVATEFPPWTKALQCLENQLNQK